MEKPKEQELVVSLCLLRSSCYKQLVHRFACTIKQHVF